jgi:hypothetical protein
MGNKEYYSLGDLLSLTQAFLFYSLKRWWLIIAFVSAAVVVAIVYHNRQKPKYEAVCTFILEEKSPGGGGLAGLASQFGFDFSSVSGGGSIFTGDNIFDILKSRNIIQKVLLTKIDSNSKSGQTLADLFLDFNNWRKRWSGKSDLENINFTGDFGTGLSLKQDSVLSLIHKYLLDKSLTVDRVNKKGSIIKVQVNASNSIFSKMMTERLVEEAAKLYMSVKTGTAQLNIDRMQRRSDSLLQLLNAKSYTAAASQMLDVNPGLKTASVPTEIVSRDKSVIAALYTEVTKNLEASKMLLSQQTPVIQILDRPQLPLIDEKKDLTILIVIGFASGLLLSLTVLVLKFLITIRNNKLAV